MKITRLILSTLAAVLVVGTIANAAPRLVSSLHADPTASPSVSVSVDPSGSPAPTDSPQPSDSGSPAPSDSPSPSPSESPSGGNKAAPDFSACVGLKGLENAICRHEALLVVNPANTGLQNSLAHLQANLVKHQAKSETHGLHGQAHGHGHAHGHSPH